MLLLSCLNIYPRRPRGIHITRGKLLTSKGRITDLYHKAVDIYMYNYQRNLLLSLRQLVINKNAIVRFYGIKRVIEENIRMPIVSV